MSKTGLTLQINSLDVLERLLGGNDETIVTIRNNIISEFSKKYFVELITRHLNIKENEIRREIEKLIEFKLRENIISDGQWSGPIKDWGTVKANIVDTAVEKTIGIVQLKLHQLIVEQIDTWLPNHISQILASKTTEALDIYIDEKFKRLIKEHFNKLANI